MQGTRLPDDVIQFIHQADTAFLATSYVARPEDAGVHPDHVSAPITAVGDQASFACAQRTGELSCYQTIMASICSDTAVFVLRLVPMLRSGNRMMNSLGNVFVTPLAGIVFPSFSTGAVLYVTGKAETLFGEAETHHLRDGLFLCRECDTHTRNVRHGGGQPVLSPYLLPVRGGTTGSSVQGHRCVTCQNACAQRHVGDVHV